ncbi:uncharacterized protein I303_102215 [Kwoniella dejecticola CBS 10117]|uniref:Uncharacterized protein n=1 Tax=Kwoniella dejecticola CBS 10117 TaxID=1296121 RepID=A0AAJ8KL64_9TREE
MSDTIPLPARYDSDSRPSSVPPKIPELTEAPPLRPLSYLPPIDIRPPAKHPRIDITSSRRSSAPPMPSHDSSKPSDRQPSHLNSSSRHRSAQQLAAEALLGMAPNRSPEKRPAEKTPLVPAPNAQSSGSTPAGASRTNAMDVDTPDSDSRGIKRKVVEDDPRLPSAVTLGLHGIDRERERAKESRYSHSPLAAAEARQPNPPASNASRLGQSPSSSILGASAANRYSVYGPTTRDPLGGSPWGLNASRYSALGLRRDLSPSVPTSTAPKPSTLDAPARATPEAARDSRFYPGSVTGYGHYSMGRRELTEHREQLREGKRWLEAMLSKTEKMLHMVENKMALTGEMGASAGGPGASAIGANANANANASSSNPAAGLNKFSNAPAGATGRITDDWEFEERERLRQKEIQRLEREREMDRVEREKRGLEREREIQRERERDRLTSTAAEERGRRERSEAERNRDLLLASRRVTAVSPNPASSPASRPGQTNGTGAGTGAGTGTPSSSSNTPAGAGAGSGNNASSGNHNTSANSTPKDREGNLREGEKRSPWEDEPVLGGVALPRREQSSLSRALGRGLWSFDVRG